MSAEELHEYEVQLAAVEESLLDDPENESLLTLKEELKDLVGLMRQAISQGIQEEPESNTSHGESERERSIEASSVERASVERASVERGSAERVSPEPEQPETVRYDVGTVVLARSLTGHKQYYEAKITSVTGSNHNPLYTVRFTRKDIKSVETVNSSCIRPLPKRSKPGYHNKPSQPEKSAPPLGNLETLDGSKKQVKQLPSQAQMLDNNKMKWQEFTKKGLKVGKGVKAKKLGESSMFQSPLGATGKVGVVGSGRGVTKPKPRTRHVFDSSTRIND